MALTLRLVCGLTTAGIARAFLRPETTVGQRLSRQVEDSERGDPAAATVRRAVPRAPAHRPRLRVSRFHRRLLGDGGGIRGPGRAVRRGAAARASAVRTRARGARGVGPVGPDVPAGQPA
nr:hypothetical protein [Prescottella equi]